MIISQISLVAPVKIHIWFSADHCNRGWQLAQNGWCVPSHRTQWSAQMDACSCCFHLPHHGCGDKHHYARSRGRQRKCHDFLNPILLEASPPFGFSVQSKLCFSSFSDFMFKKKKKDFKLRAGVKSLGSTECGSLQLTAEKLFKKKRLHYRNKAPKQASHNVMLLSPGVSQRPSIWHTAFSLPHTALRLSGLLFSLITVNFRVARR